MKPLQFRLEYSNGLYAFRYTSGVNRIVEKNWPGLFKDWPQGRNPFSEFNVNNNNCEEVAIYLGLVWRLSESLTRYGMPCALKDEVARATAPRCEPVRWKYQIVAEQEGVLSDRGFVQTAEGEGCLLELRTFKDLVVMQRTTLSDAEAEINIFCLRAGRGRDLLKALQTKERPKLDRLLDSGEMVVDMVIGVDRGHYDSILIKSPSNISDRLNQLVQEYANLIADYESKVSQIEDMEQFLMALQSLALGKL